MNRAEFLRRTLMACGLGFLLPAPLDLSNVKLVKTVGPVYVTEEVLQRVGSRPEGEYIPVPKLTLPDLDEHMKIIFAPQIEAATLAENELLEQFYGLS